jgi:hypothetical protein
MWAPKGKWGAIRHVWAPKGKWGAIKANVSAERQMWAPKRHMGCRKGMCGYHKGMWALKGKWGAIRHVWVPKGKWGFIKANVTFCHKFEKHGANEHRRVIYMLWQSQAMLFVIMLCQHKATQLYGHPRYAAMAIFQHVYTQLAPMLYGYGNLPAQKYATCSPAMRLQQFAGTLNTQLAPVLCSTAICRRVKYATCFRAIRYGNFPAQKLQLAGSPATRLAGAMLRYCALWLAQGWILCQWLARGLSIAPNG